MNTASMARDLLGSMRSKQPIEPFTDRHPLTVEHAYAVQKMVREELHEGAGSVVVKLGLTSRAKQVQMKVGEPIYGWYLPGSGIDAGGSFEVASGIHPKVEPEIALVTDRPLEGPDVTSSEVLAATRSVAPALDVLDSRFIDYRFRLPDVVADNASASRYVVGAPIDVATVDIGSVGCVFERDGEVVATASGAAVLGHPAAAVAWLVRKLHEHGENLPAGSTVLAGSLTEALPANAGESVRITIEDMGHLDLLFA